MSKSKSFIKRIIRFRKVRDVFLNRGGVNIGRIVKFRGVKAYLSWRTKEHYFVKYRGFGIDKNLLSSLVDDEIGLIIIEYKGPRGMRYYFSSVDDWYFNSTPVSYTKEVGDTVETYGVQKVLCEDYMDEVIVKL